MLNLFDPIKYSPKERTHVDSVLKPQKKDGWKDEIMRLTDSKWCILILIIQTYI